MKLESLTFTRYVAALTVVFFHFGREAWPANIDWLNPLITAGPIAVCYFFVLSGFIMAIAYYSPRTKPPLNKGRYWVARLARIYPVYLLALLFMIAESVRKGSFDGLAALLNITMLQAWVPGGYPLSYNSPGWSLSVEAFFYLTFPLWLIWAQKRHFASLVLFAILFWVFTQFLQFGLLNNILNTQLGLPLYEARVFMQSHDQTPPLHDFIYYNPFMHLSTFVMGFVVGVYFRRGYWHGFSVSTNTTVMLLSALLAALLILGQAQLEQWSGVKIAYNNGLIAPFFITFIVCLALDKTLISRVFSLPILVLLGEASYSLYILQRPVYGVYKQVTASFLPEGSTLHFYIFAAILTLLAILSYRYFETPIRLWINRHYISSGKTS
ncbi:acyltransferase family protein [Thiofilum flexile]|uniref:acyltransferase family protein n=1 Tax=Thiofilum flexile TaxID=125627 RepID=UPI00035EC990|nr:acyltransferase [Thiofilum flexile]